MAAKISAGELHPEDAAAAVGVSRSTAYAAGQRAASTPAQVAASIPKDKLLQLAELVSRLPLAQQDQIVAGLAIDAARRDAVARGLAHHPSAAADVARELRSVKV